MIAALLVLAVAFAVFWLIFFRFKLIRLTPGWGFIFGFFVVHLMLVFLIGLRFVTPYSTNATVVQRTIQLIPRLPEPTLVTDVLVEEGAPVKKGQPIFQFDRRPYEYKVNQIQAQLAEAKQNVRVLKLDVEVAAQDANRTKVELAYLQYQKKAFDCWPRSRRSGRWTSNNGLPELMRRRPRPTARWPHSNALKRSTNPRLTASIPPSPTWRRN